MNTKELQQRIEELIDAGFEVDEGLVFVIRDSRGHEYGRDENEEWAWRETFQMIDSAEIAKTRRWLKRWNAAVVGKRA